MGAEAGSPDDGGRAGTGVGSDGVSAGRDGGAIGWGVDSESATRPEEAGAAAAAPGEAVVAARASLPSPADEPGGAAKPAAPVKKPRPDRTSSSEKKLPPERLRWREEASPLPAAGLS